MSNLALKDLNTISNYEKLGLIYCGGNGEELTFMGTNKQWSKTK